MSSNSSIASNSSGVISSPAELGHYQVTAEVLGPVAGPKINMIHYRNKTGYRRRLGHRQRYTQVRITGIGTEAKPSAKQGANPHAKPQSKARAQSTAEAKAEED